MQGVLEFYEDLPPRPKRPERLFFCLFPDVEAAAYARQRAGQLVREYHLEGNLLEQARLHLSLYHLGDFGRLSPKVLFAADQAAKAVSVAPFEIICPLVMSFEGAPGRSRKRPLVLLAKSDPLLEIHRVLGAALRRNGLRAAAHFTPHMTLFYGSKPIPLQATEPIRFVARELALVHNERWLKRLGEYHVIERWPLQG